MGSCRSFSPMGPDSASNPTITIVRNAGTPEEYRQEGISARIEGNTLVTNSSTNATLQIYDEIHADYLNEPWVITAIRLREVSNNQ
jgi:hypothetical protein